MSPKILRGAALAAALAGAAVFVAGAASGSATLRIAGKPWPVAALLALTLVTRKGRMARLVALALFASLVGDVLFEISPALFIPGLVAFLVAHLFYIAGFVVDAPALRPLRAAPVAVYGVAMVARLWPHLGALRPAIALYAAALCAMLWRAAARIGASRLRRIPARGAVRREEIIGLVGAITFVASDTLFAEKLFVGPYPGSLYAVIVTYWLGQWGLAASVPQDRHAS